MSDDAHLLSAFVRDRSEAAFRELVRRHLALVLATARRVLGGDPHLAQDVAQVVFTDFARKAPGLPADTVPAGWLWRHTRFVAANTARAESRRRQREHTAMHLHALDHDPGLDARWQRLAPVLDDVLATLDPSDRDALVLRYLGDASLRDVGRALGTGEDAAQKRTARALEKLRATLLSRGVTFSAALLATTLEAGAASPAPPSLVASVTRAALAPTAGAALLTMLKTKTFLATVASLAVVVTLVLSSTETAPSASVGSASTSAAVDAVTPVAPNVPPPDANAAIARALAQLANSQRGTDVGIASASFSPRPNFFAETGNLNVSLPSSISLSRVVQLLSDASQTAMTAPTDLVQQPSRLSFMTYGKGMLKAEIAPLLKPALEATGLNFDPQPDGSWRVRTSSASYAITEEIFLITLDLAGLHTVTTREGNILVTKTVSVFSPPSPQIALAVLISWSTGKQVGSYGYAQERTYCGAPVADRVDISPGVWRNRTELKNIIIQANSLADARTQLIAALRQQAGIVAQITPDRTLQIRLETGDNDPVVSAHDFNGTSVPEVLRYLSDITGQTFQFGRNVYSASLPSVTLHLDSGPVSRTVTAVLNALEQQHGLIADNTSNQLAPLWVELRLTADADAKQIFSFQRTNTPASDILGDLRRLTGKSIAASPASFTEAKSISLSMRDVSRVQAIKLLRDALEQQAGIVIDEKPDGNFTARWANPPAPASP